MISMYALLMNVLLWGAFSLTLSAESIEKKFQNVNDIKLKLVSGDCVIQQGSGSLVNIVLTYTYDPEDYDPEFYQSGSTLRLSEDFAHDSGSRSGMSKWQLTVPENTEIDFNTASGDLEISDLKAKIKAEAASGDITLNNIQADCEIGTVSGDMMVSGISLTGDSEFGAASGDIEISLAKTTIYDIEMSTASGNVSLDFAGNDIRGTITVTARASQNRIRAPFDFDDEKFYTENGRDYVIKTVRKGDAKPMIVVNTVSGKATLSK